MEKITLKDISHSFTKNRPILKDINFTLQRGEIKALLGESGCGKTTILHICADLLQPKSGVVTNSFKNSSFVFQEPRLLPWFNVIENIALVLKEKGLSKEKINQKAQKIALRLGLKEEDFAKYPKDLSGGMKQRVSFARALVTQPSLLLLDEPFSALDIGLKKELYEILLNEVKQKKLSILFITHDLIEAVTLSDEVLMIKKAKDGSQITNRYSFNLAYNKRDDAFIYKNMLLLAKEF